ncbi:MAG: hypothetical protein AAFP97_06925 [Pseudomonadota bacterium]
MRVLALTVLSAGLMSACASVPTAPTPYQLASIEGATPGMLAAAQATDEASLQAAQLTTIRNAEARLDLARARLDLATIRQRGADDGDVREFLDARRALRNARNVYGPTDTGRQEVLIGWFNPYAGRWPRPNRHWLAEPDEGSTTLNSGAAMPLSSLNR